MTNKLVVILKNSSTLFLVIILQITGIMVSGQSFTEDWTMPIQSNDSCTVYDMVIDENNSEVYLVGSFKGDMSPVFPTGVNGTFDFSTNYGGWDGFVAKYDLAGGFIWAFYVGGTGKDEVKAIDVSALGNFYITGNFEMSGYFNGINGGTTLINASFGGADIFQVAYSASGNLNWGYEGGSSGDDNAVDVKYVEGYNRVVFAGNYYSSAIIGGMNIGVSNNTYQTFVMGREDNGMSDWLHTPRGVGDEIGIELAVKNGDIYLVGEFMQDFSIGTFSIANINSSPKVFCLKMDAYGNLDWLTYFYATLSLNLEGAYIHNNSDRILLTGSYTGQIVNDLGILSSPSVGEDCFLLALNENSNLVSGIKTLHSDLSSGKVIGKSISQLPNNEGVLLACDFTESFQPDPGLVLTSISQKDGVILFIDSLFNYRASNIFSSVGDIEMSNIDVGQNNKLFHAENWSQSIQLDISSFTSSNYRNVALGRYAINLSCYFEYPQNTYCSDTGMVDLDSVSMAFGYFYNLDDNIFIDSSTGSIDISSSLTTSGSYVYHKNIGCLDSVLISVKERFNAYLTVDSTEYCRSDQSIDLLNFNAGDSGGVWSGSHVVGSNLLLNNNDEGVFLFQYSAPISNFCPSSTIDSVIIDPNFDPSWLGLSENYCSYESDLILSSLITGDSDGTFLFEGNVLDTLVFSDLPMGVATITYRGMVDMCSADSSVTIKVFDGFSNAGQDDSICGVIANLEGFSSQTLTVWSAITPGTLITDEYLINTEVEVDMEGLYQFELLSENGECEFRDTVKIVFLERPELNAGLDQTVTTSGDVLSGTGTASNVNWSVLTSAMIDPINSYNSDVSNLALGDNIFILEGMDTYCEGVPDTVVIRYENITVPNSFSPNGDGFNDTFELIGLETYDMVSLTILTKWGEILMTIEDYNNDWDGRVNNNPLAEGVYFYMIDYENNKAQGFIEIKR